VESLGKIGQQMKAQDIVEYFVPLVKVGPPRLPPYQPPLSLRHAFSLQCLAGTVTAHCLTSRPPLPFVSTFPSLCLDRGWGRGSGSQRGCRPAASSTSCTPSAPEPTRTELRALYGQLCHDDMPMVRRSAAQHMGKFAGTVEHGHGDARDPGLLQGPHKRR